MDIRVFVKPPFRPRRELGRARIELKKAFSVLEERTNVEDTLYYLTGKDEIFITGKVFIEATLRPSFVSKASIFDFKLVSPKKSFISPSKPSPKIKDESITSVDPKKRVILSLKKVTTSDMIIMSDVDVDTTIGQFTFCLEATYGSNTTSCPYQAGKVRTRNKDVIANLSFEDLEMDFEMSRESMLFDELNVLMYAKDDNEKSPNIVGRAVLSLSHFANKPDNEKMVKICAQIKNAAGTNTGKMFMNMQLSPSGRKRRFGEVEVIFEAQHTMLPKDLECGWVRITSVEAIGLNSLKLLGRKVRYAHLQGTRAYDILTKQVMTPFLSSVDNSFDLIV